MNRTPRLLRHFVSADAILSRDLFLFHPQVNSAGKISYVGTKPSFYPRTVTEYDSPWNANVAFGRNNSISETLEHDPSFHKLLESRTERVQEFLGPQMPMSFPDLLCVLCGVSEMSVETSQGSETEAKFTKLHFDHDRLRDIGERFYNLHSICSTVFADLQHLSTSQMELQESLKCLDDRTHIITEFMKSNGLYNCIIPYRGPTAGNVLPHDKHERLKEQIKDDTCVASFFTLLGITSVRFGSQKVLDHLWHPKIMGSDTGILKLVTDKITKS